MEDSIARSIRRGETVPLVSEDNTPFDKIFIGCSWGAVRETSLLGLISYSKDIDLDLSCIMFNSKGHIVDHIYSPLYLENILSQFGLPKGKSQSADKAVIHTGDDINGDRTPEGEDTDNEVILFNLDSIDKEISSIFFFFNNCGKEDFEKIPYARIRIVEGTPEDPGNEILSYHIDGNSDCAGKKALIIGKLFRNKENRWCFNAIGDPVEDQFLGYTVHRIASDYAEARD